MLNNVKLKTNYNVNELSFLDKNFNTACFFVKKNWNNISMFYKLSLYSLYKQATIGNCNIKCSIFNYKKYIKMNNWNDVRGMSKRYAKIEYIKIYNLILCKK